MKDYKDISDSAKWLYCTLVYLKTNSHKDDLFIGCTDQKLARIMNYSTSKLKRVKAELKDAGLIETTIVCDVGQSDRKTIYKI